jgi:Insertion element 4 transposase N-terminal
VVFWLVVGMIAAYDRQWRGDCGRPADGLGSLGVLAAFVPRDAVDDAAAAAGKQAKRSDGKLPPHVMVYFVMALALFAEDDYEEVAARLTETLTAWGCWDDSWSVPTSGGITQARQRLGYEPMKELFTEVAAPVAEELTTGAFLGPWRLMAIDGFEWDAPDTKRECGRVRVLRHGLMTRAGRRTRRCGW